MKRLTFNLVIAGIILSEILLFFNKLAGFLVYVVLAGVILVSMEKDINMTKSEKLLVVLMILPILRISEFFIDFNVFWHSMIFYFFMIFLTGFYIVKLSLYEDYPINKVGNHLIAVMAGFAVLFISSNFFEFSSIMFLIPFIAYSEELFFRGALQNLVKSNYGIVLSVVLTSVLYTTFSLSLGFPGFLYVLGGSIAICLAYWKTKSLIVTIILNMIMQALIIIYLIPKGF